jgi:hypothetical protein
MDPITLMATAQTAYSALKVAIDTGKEMQGMAADLSSLWSSVAQIVRVAHEEVPVTSITSGKSPEQIAMERFAAKQKAMEMSYEIKNAFVGQYGLAAWDTIQSEVVKIRKEAERIRLEQERLKQKRAAEIKSALEIGVIVAGSIAGILIIGAGLFVAFVHPH